MSGSRVIINLEPMPDVDLESFGLWLDMVIRNETQHTIRSLQVEQLACRP